MVSPVIQSALQQMQSLAAEAAGGSGKTRQLDAAVGQGNFAEELHTSIERINQLQQTAKAKGVALQSGVEGVSLNEVMVDMQKASVAFEMGVQVRNRLITAYKEIMNMQV